MSTMESWNHTRENKKKHSELYQFNGNMFEDIKIIRIDIHLLVLGSVVRTFVNDLRFRLVTYVRFVKLASLQPQE